MIGREEIQRMRVQIFVVLEGVSERGERALCPLCFHQFVPSPFCEGARSAARSACSEPRITDTRRGVVCTRHCQTTLCHQVFCLAHSYTSELRLPRSLADYLPWPRRRKPGASFHLIFNLILLLNTPPKKLEQ